MMRSLLRTVNSIIALLVLLAGTLSAQSGIFDRAGSIAGHGTYSSVPGETVDLFTGNLMLSYRDIFLPGPEGLNLEVWRVYNSKVLGDGSPGHRVSGRPARDGLSG